MKLSRLLKVFALAAMTALGALMGSGCVPTTAEGS